MECDLHAMMLFTQHFRQWQSEFETPTNRGACDANLSTPLRDVLGLAIEGDTWPATTNWGCESILEGPRLQSLMQKRNRYSQFSRPCRQGLTLPVKGYGFRRTRTNGLSKRLLRCPVTTQAASDYESIEASHVTPLGQRMGFAVGRDEAIGAHIAHLRFTCRPSAILAAIWAVVVDAIQRVHRWRIAHILIEGDKAVDPRLADCDTPTTIAGKVLVAWVKAAILHMQPRLVCSRISFAVSFVHEYLLALLYGRNDLLSSFNIWTVGATL